MGWFITMEMLIVLLQITSSVTLESGSPKILSFSFEEWDPSDSQWRSTTDIKRGTFIRLVCTIDSPSSETFKIRKLDEPNALEHVKYPNHRQIIHEFGNLECDSFGVYVCEDGLGTSQIIELGIFDCEPRLCDDGDTTTKISSVALNEAIILDVCVLAYPEIGVDMMTPAHIPKRSTDTDSEASRIRHSPTTTDELEDPDAWKYDVEPDPDTFGAYKVRISKPRISRDDYGGHTFAIFTTHGRLRKQLEYTLVLEPSETGPPDCPTDLKVTDPEADSLTLSWQPGFDGGSPQFFLVYISRDEEWSLTSTSATGNSAHISGLEPNTQYAFRVIPHNEFSQEPNVDLCQNTVEGMTGKLSKAVDDKTNHGMVAVCVVLGLLTVAVIGLVVIIFCKRNNKKSFRSLAPTCCSAYSGVEQGLMLRNKRDEVDASKFG